MAFKSAECAGIRGIKLITSKPIVFPFECTKNDIHKVPLTRNLSEMCLKSKKLISSTLYQCLTRDNYGVSSGPFCSSFIRSFTTENQKWGYRTEIDYNNFEWIEKTKKQNTKSSDLNTGKETLKRILKQDGSKTTVSVPKKKRLLIKPKAEIANKHFHMDAATNNNITGIASFLRKHHLCKPLPFDSHNTETSKKLICFLPLRTFLICYKTPEKNLSLFVKYYHDWKTPDFTSYRSSLTSKPDVKSRENKETKKLQHSLINTAFGLGLVYGIKNHGIHYVMTMSATADVLALAKVEILLTDVPEGRSVTFKWRGKPLFIRHRTPEQIATERSLDISILRDPQRDEDRCKDPKYMIMIGVCTHLGCVPIADAGDFPGGYYCPCHGSHFDGSGRVRKGPAPTNLEIPEYTFEGNIVIVG